MPASERDRDFAAPRAQGFATTRWTVVLRAGERAGPEAREALASLCEAYWYPLYAFLRRRGHAPDDAADLTQGFFARLLEKNALGAVRRGRGRFRSYLLAALENHLQNRRRGERAKKRGGGRTPLSLDRGDAEERYRLEPAHEMTPERVYERRWALTLLERALDLLRAEMEAAGKGELFAKLKPSLNGEGGGHAALAREIGMSEGAVKVAVHRLRSRFREHLRAEIAQTVSDPADIDEEIRDLQRALES